MAEFLVSWLSPTWQCVNIVYTVLTQLYSTYSVYLLSNSLYPSLTTFSILNTGPKDQVLFL
jgi:hypothetical protein